ncbi:MAG: ATP-binding cassette domain-containing protein, partial [Chitinophagaceae bacterium]|nr:ATP-binding cassette domain-containing protein [Chitinophagaceae bacterium]
MSQAAPILEARNVSKYFHDPLTVQVLKDISFTIQRGEFIAVIGKSGCGKSTLLYVLSTMDTDYEGNILLEGTILRGKKDAELARIRNNSIGFVFQFHYLLNEFSVLKNV